MLHMLITASRTLIHTGTSPKTHMVRKTVRFNRQEVKTENPTIILLLVLHEKWSKALSLTISLVSENIEEKEGDMAAALYG